MVLNHIATLTFSVAPLFSFVVLLLLLLLHRLSSVAAAAAALVLHHRRELWPLLQQRYLGALPVEVGDRRQALEPDATAAAAAAVGVLLAAAAAGEVAGGDGEGEAEALGAVGGGKAAEVGVVGLNGEMIFLDGLSMLVISRVKSVKYLGN